MFKTITLIFVFSLTAAVFGQAAQADLVVVNGNVRTMNPEKPTAKSLAVIGGKIAAIGDESDTKPLIGPRTKVIDAKGRLIVPGFNDAHVHFLETGQQLSSVDLRTAKSPQEFVARIKQFASKLPKGRWILGGKWDHENWTPANLPTAAMIDAVTPDNPVFIDRLDGHMALANSLAMKMAKIDKSVKDVAGGEIVRDGNGNPTGIFKDAAMSYIGRAIPEPDFQEKLEAAQA
ncbi:MAG TPA: amidohydrolase, partial [Blastocatellia bacterium]|nr:amidohydrolase [Blastocatellia bacterium]